ncbi:MAG: hypothetical protein K2Q03_00915 [Sphingobacteriaceae bacterium]|nr:hypothetical protein [Sphingobacteriaceae bacterium]
MAITKSKNKKKQMKSFEVALDEILNDDKQTEMLVEYLIEVNQREANLKTTQRELKETFEAIKNTFNVSKVDVKKIIEYAKALFSDENMDATDKHKIELMRKLSERIVELADSNKALERILTNA